MLGEGEKLTPYEALKAVTINAAYQYFEEDTKGVLMPGRQADLVILSEDPTKIDPMKIRDIKVLKTIKSGEDLYSAD